MVQYLKFILPAYLLAYFIVLLLVPALVVGRKIGKSPLILSASDDAHGLIAKYFLVWLILSGVYVATFCLFPAYYPYFKPMHYLESDTWRICGLIILAISLIWTSAAQINMQASWRVGIDDKQKTELVKSGIFRFSRNPIYLGMIFTIMGLFFLTPNAFTLLMTIVGYILVQIQVRLEEEFLYEMHGQAYLDYKSSVRRFV